MTWFTRALRSSTGGIALVALLVVGLDQLTKQVVMRFVGYGEEINVVPGFFRLVHWGNSGAAFSLFRNNNTLLAAVAVIALVALYMGRHHFNARTLLGQLSLGLICGGILGNLIDRVLVGHVVDFLYFHVHQRGGRELGFPAFNVADSAICTGVALVFLNTWRTDREEKKLAETASAAASASSTPKTVGESHT